MSVGSEPSWRVEVGGDENGGGGARGGELESGEKVSTRSVAQSRAEGGGEGVGEGSRKGLVSGLQHL